VCGWGLFYLCEHWRRCASTGIRQGTIAYNRGAIAEERDLYAQALAVYKALDELGTAIVLGVSGNSSLQTGTRTRHCAV